MGEARSYCLLREERCLKELTLVWFCQIDTSLIMIAHGHLKL